MWRIYALGSDILQYDKRWHILGAREKRARMKSWWKIDIVNAQYVFDCRQKFNIF